MPAKLEFDKIITVKMPVNGIHYNGIRSIIDYMFHCGFPPLPAGFEWVWSTERGTLPKRIASALYNEHGFKMDDESLGKIGTIGSMHTEKKDVFYIDFTKSINWTNGDFGDSASCFWTTAERRPARKMIEENGFAIRFYNSPDSFKGYGRAWCGDVSKQIDRPDDDAYVMFNAYGLDLLSAARVMANYLGLEYRTTAVLCNNQATEGTLFINSSGRGIFIASSSTLEQTSFIEKIDLKWKDKGPVCEKCNSSIRNPRIGANSENLCGKCFDALYYTCRTCGCPHSRVGRPLFNDRHTNQNYCPECHIRYFAMCEGCAKEHHKENLIGYRVDEIGKHYCCTECHYHLRQCAACTQQYLEAETRKSRRLPGIYCAQCFEKIEKCMAEKKPDKTMQYKHDLSAGSIYFAEWPKF